ncbi:MAG: STAS domain-containing protein [Candidatus Omnitrophota bacterium]
MAGFFSVRKNGQITVAEILKNEITMYEIDIVKKDFAEILENDSKDVILVFKNLDFISSLVLAGMVYLLKLTKDKGGKLKLCELRDKVKEVFKVTDLDKVFEIYPTESEALKSFE